MLGGVQIICLMGSGQGKCAMCECHKPVSSFGLLWVQPTLPVSHENWIVKPLLQLSSERWNPKPAQRKWGSSRNSFSVGDISLLFCLYNKIWYRGRMGLVVGKPPLSGATREFCTFFSPFFFKGSESHQKGHYEFNWVKSMIMCFWQSNFFQTRSIISSITAMD